MSTHDKSSYESKLLICKNKILMARSLHKLVIEACKEALSSTDGIFSIALSGGSLPSFLVDISESFDRDGTPPQWEKWHVLLADERCVPSTDEDSNLKALKQKFLDAVPIPKDQIYGIDESLLSSPSCEEKMANVYERSSLRPVLEKSGNKIDCVILGFGPDGHTCSLFPDHKLLHENEKLVAGIDDSPKPPPKRITLTFPVLNNLSKKIVFCGAGESKGPILNRIFSSLNLMDTSADDEVKEYTATLTDPAPFPCGMARPKYELGQEKSHKLFYVVDSCASETLSTSKL